MNAPAPAEAGTGDRLGGSIGQQDTSRPAVGPETTMTPAEAEDITSRIIAGYETLVDDIRTAIAGKAWAALGFAGWAEYAETRFAHLRLLRLDREDRRELVASLHDCGVSNRQIAASISVNEKTVRNDLATRAEKSARDNEQVIADGLAYLATLPPEIYAEVAEQARAVMPADIWALVDSLVCARLGLVRVAS